MLKENHLNRIAQSLGHEGMKEALHHIYEVQKNTLEECSEKLDLSVHTLRSLMKQYGICTRQDQLKKLTISSVELRKNTVGQIASKYGISRSSAWRLKQSAKLTKKSSARGGGS